MIELLLGIIVAGIAFAALYFTGSLDDLLEQIRTKILGEDANTPANAANPVSLTVTSLGSAAVDATSATIRIELSGAGQAYVYVAPDQNSPLNASEKYSIGDGAELYDYGQSYWIASEDSSSTLEFSLSGLESGPQYTVGVQR